MKNKTMILGALLLTLAVSACHKDADMLHTYAYNDQMAFGQADESYAGKFRVFWNAMNQNYTLWDFEEEQGLDWDAVYDEYLPKFEALDKPGTQVTDSALKVLMTDLISPLHDGHMSVQFKNHQTGHYVTVSPGNIRNGKRADVKELEGFSGDISYYSFSGDLARYESYDCTIRSLLRNVLSTPGKGMQWVKTRLAELGAKSTLTEGEVILFEALSQLYTKYETLAKKPISMQWLSELNALIDYYSYLNIPYFEKIDTRFIDYGIFLQFALTKDNIAYLQFSQFSLSLYLDENQFESELGGSEHNYEIRQNVVHVWQSWFDTVQELHKKGQLNGVVIDVRSNPGGAVRDASYALGALLPAGGLQYGWARFKRGVGRYDFSPLMPKVMFTMDEPHEVVDDKPIVVLANGSSVSMAEMTSLTAKQVKNAVLMGRQTFGGLCALVGNNYNTENYSGHIGVSGQTPVYVYLPTECILNMDKKPLDGIGVTPDIEVAFDADLYKKSYRDSQFERALEYIRTGK